MRRREEEKSGVGERRREKKMVAKVAFAGARTSLRPKFKVSVQHNFPDVCLTLLLSNNTTPGLIILRINSQYKVVSWTLCPTL